MWHNRDVQAGEYRGGCKTLTLGDHGQPSSSTSAIRDRQWWHHRIQAARSDTAELDRIDQDLQLVPESWARVLRMQAIQLRAAGHSSKWAIQHPRLGEPLYRRRLSAADFDALQARLRVHAGLKKPDGLNPAEVVLWGAEWFRRGYVGGHMRWDDVNAALGWHLGHDDWRDLVDRGLAAHRLKPLRIGGTTHRLRTLAQQGGFPVAALKEGSSGAPSRFLERLVAALLPETVLQVGPAITYAEALSDTLPHTWQGEHFLLLCADLAVAIVRLREEASRGGALGAAAPSAWLDANRPGWRSDLPLSVDEGGARQLVDALMRVVPERGPLQPVRASRLIIRLDAGWQEQARFDLVGTLALPGVRQEEWSRLRLFAAGALARHVSGELGAVERDGGKWLSSASAVGARLHPIPFSCAIEVEVRGAGRRVAGPLMLTRGQPVDGPFLACRVDDEAAAEDEDAPPSRLLLIGTSGGSFRADPVFVLAELGWTAVSENGSAEVVDRAGHKALWRISGMAVLRGPDGDRYKVRTGCPADSLPTLSLVPRRPDRARVSGTAAVVSWGMPDLHFHQDNHGSRSTALAWRRVGDPGWLPTARFDGLGLCEFGLRDTGGDFWLDRQKCIVVPAAFQVTAERRRDATAVQVAGWPGVCHVNGADHVGDDWLLPIDGRGRSEVAIRLAHPGMQLVVLHLRLPQRAVVASWSGNLLAPRTRVGLADLGELVARSDGTVVLDAMLRDGSGRPVPQAGLQWHTGDELPLGSVRADIAALLRPLGDLDARVDLQFADSEHVWQVGEFSIQAPRSVADLRGEARPGDRLVARPVQDAATEHEIGPDEPTTPGNGEVALAGQGSELVFLRRGGRVASRPRIESLGRAGPPPSGPLGAAMALPGHAERQAALEALLCEASVDAPEPGDRAEAILSDIIRLATSLDGLPPSTFDTLVMLPRHPRVLARMLFSAGDEQVASLLALADGLPFAWPLLAQFHWTEAGDRLGRIILGQIPTTMSLVEQLSLAADIVKSRKQAIVAAGPALASLLGFATGPRREQRSLAEAMMAFMQENHDEQQGGSSPFRPDMQASLPDIRRFDDRFWRALDAPCAAAVAARRRMSLSPLQLRCVKDIHRRFPRYFEQAFAARWRELNHAKS